MQELNEANFSQSTQQGLFLIDFSAEWCGPCKMLAPILETIQNIQVFKIDVDKCHDLATNFNINSIPCLVFLKDGVEVDRIVGLAGKALIQDKANILAEIKE